ncbi:phosphomannomutase|uniref:Phosphomannomutase n=1 Tax=Dendrosporobacter quercicolus TaxID=146817 RepID=A0A1G9WRW1_9FIRM|nr:phosphomannomutase [Dendrosporobacter quercicolus]NSL49184.1 phosphomannomutase [Dendrosporobacter quercicolus DSM 1736]SDM86866.1 phosphomannomutase [Dendrosporobacter quercicolus]
MQLLRNAFKAYDIRGKVPEELNEEMAYRIGRAFVAIFKAGKVAVGHDIRLSGPLLRAALVRGLTEAGCDVVDIGVCGTEQIYFATAHWQLDGGIMITASHNPQEYNGMKLVQAGARPVSGDSGLKELEEAVIAGAFPTVPTAAGQVSRREILPEYIRHLLGYVDKAALKPLKVVVNAGNGAAGPVIDALERQLPFTFVKVNHEPDGNFPNGIPNPLLVENREATAKVVRETGADIGIAWDGDFDRCFLFDETGAFIEGYYLVGFLAQAFLRKHPGAKIVHDPRLTWNTIEVVTKAGGIPIQNKTGHAFMKERLRREDAVYGGEMSAHHYFRDFAYCDSGMIPWLLVLEIVSLSGKPLSQLLRERVACYPVSGEINRQVAEPAAVIRKLEEIYAPAALVVDYTDGVSIELADWRFNVRMSNTEPVLRLNVESRCDERLMREKTAELLALIRETRV